MFLGYQDNKIKFYTEERLNEVLYNLDKVEETDKEYVLVNDEYVLNDEEQKAKELAKAKQIKYDEANNGAKAFLDSGEALFELDENKHIEATDGNIGKLNAYITGFSSGVIEREPWSTKEDEVIMLDLELTTKILLGIMGEQTRVWTILYPHFLELIEQATTVEEVNDIVIDYRQVEEELDNGEPEETLEGTEEPSSTELPDNGSDTTTEDKDEVLCDNEELVDGE